MRALANPARRAVEQACAVGALAAGALILALGAGCKGRALSAAEVTDRAWRAHERVVAAGEGERTCAAAGAAMRRAFDEHRQAFVAAMALDRDRARLEQAADFIAANEARYRDLETRMAALSERCADEPAVAEVFRRMEDP